MTYCPISVQVQTLFPSVWKNHFTQSCQEHGFVWYIFFYNYTPCREYRTFTENHNRRVELLIIAWEQLCQRYVFLSYTCILFDHHCTSDCMHFTINKEKQAWRFAHSIWWQTAQLVFKSKHFPPPFEKQPTCTQSFQEHGFDWYSFCLITHQRLLHFYRKS